MKKLRRQMRTRRTRGPLRSDLVVGVGVLLVGILRVGRGGLMASQYKHRQIILICI